jgi:two-component system nitrate/nitrite response regulator NarL
VGLGDPALHRGIDEGYSASVNLTDRQRQIMERLCEGKPTKVIARDLGLCPNTVKEHLYQAYKRLGVTGRVQAALAFKQRDI